MVSRRVVGIDGCQGGWVAVTLVDGQVADVVVVARLAELLGPAPTAGINVDHDPPGGAYDAVAIDVPIGLLNSDRDADTAARDLLPRRASSVFSAPPAAVVEAVRGGHLEDHTAASALAVEVTGRGMSVQTWRLVPKVIEVDDLVRAGARPMEVHPEVAFAMVVGEALPRKRSWAGAATRRAVLQRLGIALPDRFVGDELAAPDDVLDAAMCAWVADGVAGAGPTMSIPHETAQIVHDRPVAMTARVAPVVEPGPRRARLVPRADRTPD